MRIIQSNVRCFKDGTDGKPACFANRGGMCGLLMEKITPCPFYKSEKRFVKEQIALQDGDMIAYKGAVIYDFVKEGR